MKIVYFTQSLISCWNHGNAHFLRGVMRALIEKGHDITVCEPALSWSRDQLLAEHPAARCAFERDFVELAARVRIIDDHPGEIDTAVDGADLVLVHEWNEPALVNMLGIRRARGAGFTLLFHDTHHRMASQPEAMARYDLSRYDGVLAFGEALSDAYRHAGWGNQVFTWHEAADTVVFKPPLTPLPRAGVVWIGNWGDGERSDELRDYLLEPAERSHLELDLYGVRYPEAALLELARRSIAYHGWIANADVPKVFARHRFTVHVPRKFYATHLPGIPTIRVFEALACGIPLLTAPWNDTEGLFSPGRDFLLASSPARAAALMHELNHDAALRESLATHGLQTITARHTCAHRADELIAIATRLRGVVKDAA